MSCEHPDKLQLHVYKFLEFEKKLRKGLFGDRNTLDVNKEILNLIIQNKCTCIYVDMKDISSIFVKRNNTYILSLLEEHFAGTQYIFQKIVLYNLSWFFDGTYLDNIIPNSYHSKVYIQPGDNPIAQPYKLYNGVSASQDTDTLYSCR
jgi:hypothetical protein